MISKATYVLLEIIRTILCVLGMFYVLSLIFFVPVTFFGAIDSVNEASIFIPSDQFESTYPLLIYCVIYIVFGYVLLKIIPNSLFTRLLKVFYRLSLVVAVPLSFLIMVSNRFLWHIISLYNSNSFSWLTFENLVNENDPILFFCVVYFVLGYILLYVPLKVISDFMRKRVLARVNRYKEKGFAPQYEVVGLDCDDYVGFDQNASKMLYIDLNDRKETMIDLKDVHSWRLEDDRLKLLTRIPEMPVIKLRINKSSFDKWNAHLITVFG